MLCSLEREVGMEAKEGEVNDEEDEEDECLAFRLLRPGSTIDMTIEKDVTFEDVSSLGDLFDTKDVEEARKFTPSSGLIEQEREEAVDVKALLLDVMEGNYLTSVQKGSFHQMTFQQLSALLHSESDFPADSIQTHVANYIATGTSPHVREYRALSVFLLGIAYLKLFCQANYTGPELSTSDMSLLDAENDASHSKSIDLLECDGHYAFGSKLCQIPQCLLFSRILLATIACPRRHLWKHGIVLTADGKIGANIICETSAEQTSAEHSLLYLLSDAMSQSVRNINSRFLWSARAAVIHSRLLQDQRYTSIPTLWNECNDSFAFASRAYGLSNSHISSSSPSSMLSSSLSPPPPSSSSSSLPCSFSLDSQALLQTQLLLEWGLCQHIFDFEDKGKQLFHRAKVCSGLMVTLTAAMGKRTKFQTKDFAQLFLFAKSSLIGTKREDTVKEPPLSNLSEEISVCLSKSGTYDEKNDNGWQHGKWEVGRRVVAEASNGEEVAIREILLDDTDGGPEENILIEGGPTFSDDQERGGDLHEVDQALILSLCLDVQNDNPKDGLTTEEMFPYLERVLQSPKNWMIHSTALLERSWLEYEKRRTADRAMLQIQALLDQHTTKLTISQSTYDSIEQAATAHERLEYLHCLVYPSQYELKRDLAYRYLRCQVFSSALNLFVELELWDEVVKSYQLLQKPHRAELVVRERLKVKETPYMLTSLADLTGEAIYYERAWVLSNNRFARAKRSLARLSFDKGDYGSCCIHMSEALSVQPLVADAWYLKGIACMKLEDWKGGLESFTRCVQQDTEVGEAWANIGAIHMKLRKYGAAKNALEEALRQKPKDWRIMENLMVVCLAEESTCEVLRYMDVLVDLRHKSHRPVHKAELRRLVELVLLKYPMDLLKSLNDNPDAQICSRPVILLEKLLVKITNSVEMDSDLWDIVAHFFFVVNKNKDHIRYRFKQFRCILDDPLWLENPKTLDLLTICGEKIIGSIRSGEGITVTDVYGALSLFSSAHTHAESSCASISSVDVEKLKHLTDQASQLHALWKGEM